METPDTTTGIKSAGWPALYEGFPWFGGEGGFPLPAYSEFMPAPRLGKRPYGESDSGLFSPEDPYGWTISEIEEEFELRPGLRHIGPQLVGAVAALGEHGHEPRLAGHRGADLEGNPFWPRELAELAGRLPAERYVVLAPLALSRTQDDKGRIRWTLFGSSEQGPERAFWKGFFEAPGQERRADEALAFFVRLLARVYGERLSGPSDLRPAGFRILPTRPDAAFPYWAADPLPSWTREFVAGDGDAFENVRYLLTFRPYGDLPAAVKSGYATGRLALLPFPGSLVFWGGPGARRLQGSWPFAFQLPLQHIVGRHDVVGGLRVPQAGWMHEPGRLGRAADIHPDLLRNAIARRHRFDGTARNETAEAAAVLDRVGRILFSTEGDALGLYGKPMARNSQILTEDFGLLLDGPSAGRGTIEGAARSVLGEGGLFRYRFQFPPMRVGRQEIYWHRPLAAFRPAPGANPEVLLDAPLGVMTAYPVGAADPSRPIFLWPRLLRREPLLAALHRFEPAADHYSRQTALNVQALFDAHDLWGRGPLPRSFARNLLRVAEEEKLSRWLAALPGRADDPAVGESVRAALAEKIEPPPDAASTSASLSARELSAPLTYGETGTRAFEESYWEDILILSAGRYRLKDNADCISDSATLAKLPPPPHHRDLEALGDYLLGRHRRAIAEAGLEGKAVCGEVPFVWRTDFDYRLFGGWLDNFEGRTHERDLLVVIPGRNRGEAVVLADHYDTAYMEDEYDRSKGGTGARLAAAGADDNHSATATLLRAAPVFLKLAREGRLERDVWLLHLTGEEFPADCMGARHFARRLVEGTLRLVAPGGPELDLAAVRVAGVYVMDMIAHNREAGRDIFQISPGRGPGSLRLAWEAHVAARGWNAWAEERNRGEERRGRGRGRRCADGRTIPEIALHPHLTGEVRTSDDPRSSLFNTDGQVFSDAGVPVVLFMENYDINRTGYHDEHDTMENIDLDYGAAVAAIAIEAAARLATVPDLAL